MTIMLFAHIITTPLLRVHMCACFTEVGGLSTCVCAYWACWMIFSSHFHMTTLADEPAASHISTNRLTPQDFQLIKVIGSGAFGVVQLVSSAPLYHHIDVHVELCSMTFFFTTATFNNNSLNNVSNHSWHLQILTKCTHSLLFCCR